MSWFNIELSNNNFNETKLTLKVGLTIKMNWIYKARVASLVCQWLSNTGQIVSELIYFLVLRAALRVLLFLIFRREEQRIFLDHSTDFQSVIFTSMYRGNGHPFVLAAQSNIVAWQVVWSLRVVIACVGFKFCRTNSASFSVKWVVFCSSRSACCLKKLCSLLRKIRGLLNAASNSCNW